MIAAIKRALVHPLLRPHSMGSPEWFEAQSQMLGGKPLVRRCYDMWYRALLDDVDSSPEGGAVVELGSGLSYLRTLRPSIITSDVVAGDVDVVLDGRFLPFADGSVRALMLTHVFHHIPDISLFLAEAERTLKPGGVISIVDCAHTGLGRLFFGKIHPEPYNWKTERWDFPAGHTMLDSNQALTWLVFVRDRVRFERQFPALRIEGPRFLPWFSYLASGGVNLRSFVPRALEKAAMKLDDWLKPADPAFAIHWHWTIRKRA